jgi:putative ABC transport system permease protein
MVLIGAALMTSLNGLNGGMQGFINQQLSVLGANLLIVTPSPIFAGFGGPSMETTPATLNEQTVKTLKSIQGVDVAVPFYTSGAKIVSSGISTDVTITGIDQSKLRVIYPKLTLENGALVQATDSIGILLGNSVAHPPGRTGAFATVGQTVSLQYTFLQDTPQGQKTQTKSRIFQVKGILNSLGSGGLDSEVFIATSAANALFEKGGKYSGIYLLTKSPQLNDQVESRIKKIYADNIGVVSPKTIAQTVQQVLGSFTSFITSIAAISMLVGGVGIVTTLYTSVMERTREIGLLKALGFRNEVVMLTFLSESALIGVIGGAIGILAGIGGAQVLTQVLPFGPTGSFTPIILPTDVATVFSLSLVLSVVAGLYPAWRAARLDPIVALRKE